MCGLAGVSSGPRITAITPVAAKFPQGQRMRAAERELAERAEAAYRRTVADWQRTQAKRKGAGRDTGTRI